MITHTKNEDVFVCPGKDNTLISLSLSFCFSPPFTHNPYNLIHFLHI